MTQVMLERMAFNTEDVSSVPGVDIGKMYRTV